MAEYLAQMSLRMATNITADAAVNTLSFVGAGLPQDLVDIEAAVFSFYDDIVGIISQDVPQTGHTLKIYDRGDPVPRVPVVEVTYDFPSAPAGGSLPHQVAMCLSFQAVKLSGESQARRRGRIYVGPLDQAVCGTNGRPVSSAVTLLRNAGDALLTFTGTLSVDWSIYSPTNGFSSVVDNGWVDDQFDIQRRRAREAISRNVFP